ncbi:hypothetical protein DENSPDRAFT_696123 [Dentipellis sp. KUC8613]|nr:hypothetical protein DENSPDRAFT_696123 [Dentipellis sp. KUC8613]
MRPPKSVRLRPLSPTSSSSLPGQTSEHQAQPASFCSSITRTFYISCSFSRALSERMSRRSHQTGDTDIASGLYVPASALRSILPFHVANGTLVLLRLIVRLLLRLPFASRNSLVLHDDHCTAGLITRLLVLIGFRTTHRGLCFCSLPMFLSPVRPFWVYRHRLSAPPHASRLASM